MKMTPAYAAQLLNQLQDEKDYLLILENNGSTYIAECGGEPDTDYDYQETKKKLEEINSRIARIRHAINLSKVTMPIPVGDKEMTADEILVRLEQMKQRRTTLDAMRKMKDGEKHGHVTLDSGITVQSYKYQMYARNEVEKDYNLISKEIMEMQLALDRHNQIDEFELEI